MRTCRECGSTERIVPWTALCTECFFNSAIHGLDGDYIRGLGLNEYLINQGGLAGWVKYRLKDGGKWEWLG